MKVSDGCKNCYAETLAHRYKKDIWGPASTTEREYKKGIWKDILRWDAEAKQVGERRRVFVASMSDFLEDHAQVYQWRSDAVDILENLQWLDILLLTKRPENTERMLPSWYHDWPAHVWFGTTIEDNTHKKRMEDALSVPAKIHFFSVEPMLSKVDMCFQNHPNPRHDFEDMPEDLRIRELPDVRLARAALDTQNQRV